MTSLYSRRKSSSGQYPGRIQSTMHRPQGLRWALDPLTEKRLLHTRWPLAGRLLFHQPWGGSAFLLWPSHPSNDTTWCMESPKPGEGCVCNWQAPPRSGDTVHGHIQKRHTSTTLVLVLKQTESIVIADGLLQGGKCTTLAWKKKSTKKCAQIFAHSWKNAQECANSERKGTNITTIQKNGAKITRIVWNCASFKKLGKFQKC